MHKGADDTPNEAKNVIDNPENLGETEQAGNRPRVHSKKDVRSQIQESNTQMSFKVTFFCGFVASRGLLY